MNYLNVTYEQLLEDFKNRLMADDRFKNIGSSTIYGMFQEMLLACMDMTNYYMQRTAEEAFITTARLDSSVIKHAKNLGYNPRRPVPAQAELIIRLKGPLPKELANKSAAGTKIIFNQDLTDLSFNGYKFILDASYSYVLTEEDITDGQNSDWVKELRYSVPSEKTVYIPLTGINYYDTSNTGLIKCFQGERKTVEIQGVVHADKLGDTNQFYDIDDLSFSNWYSHRDPFAYNRDNFSPVLSWTKVGIGPTEEDAFKTENLFTIEDQSIFLNSDLVKLNNTIPDKPLKICLIDTNSDKTVRVTFTSEPTICDIGLKTNKDNLYVQYISTKGREANTTGTKEGVMSHANSFYVSVGGNIIDVTNNVQFIINSDIYGGDDFEKQESIKINAPAYFASRLKLISKSDYISYFKALTSPINVQNALVFGQHELEELSTSKRKVLYQNNIFYCLLGHLYLKNAGNWCIKNVLTENNDNADPFCLYSDDYNNHLCDYVKSLYSYESFYNTQYNDFPEEQYLKNIRLIRENCKHNVEVNTALFSLPPIVQYFDLVGTVRVKSMTDKEKYLTELKNKVFEYLDNRASYDRKIYKSDIIRLYTEHEYTRSVDLDIKVSNLIRSSNLEYNWSYEASNNYKFELNKSLDSYKTLMKSHGPSWSFGDNYPSAWNQIRLPKLDNYSKKIYEKMFENKRILLKYQTQHAMTEAWTEERALINKFDVYEDDKYVYICPQTIQARGRYTSSKYHDDFVNWLKIYIPSNDDYYSKSDFGLTKVNVYKIDGTTFRKVETLLNNWLNGLMITESADRTIDLPYDVYSNETLTRHEGIMRKGNLYGDYETTLSEESFWNYFVPKILKTAYPKITESSDINGELWKAAQELILDIYYLIKPGICDSILDDCNNIVNFSTPMEVAILDNLINVEYET